MRLTLLNQFFAPDMSPTAQLAASLTAHRAKLGDDVTVVAGRAGYLEGLDGPQASDTSPGLKIHRVWTPDLGKSSLSRRLLGYLTFSLGAVLRMLRMPRQDVVVAMTTPPLIVLAAVAHQLLHRDTRIVLWSMDCYPDAAERFGELRAGGLPSRILRRITRWAFGRLETVVALDGAMAELLESQYAAGPGRPRICVIPNWEPRELFPATAPAPWPGYQDLDVAGRAVVVYLGNIGMGHCFDTALAAAEELRDEALFLFVGGGARLPQLRAAANRRGLDNVVFRTYVPKEETRSVMAGADAALITLDERSLGVMSPSKLHANLAAGLPILYVGPAGSNVDEAIAAHGVGVSVREGDAAGVVNALRSLRDDEELRRRARKVFEEAYSDAATLPAFDRLLDN